MRLTLRALGPEGWAQRPENMDVTVPARAAWSWPALFEGDRLEACAPFGVGPKDAILLEEPDGAIWTHP